MKIKDIANIAGVAPSTVSRVINNSGYVSQDIREKVEKIINDTGYIPNSIAKSLKTKKTNTIGIIIPQISSKAVSKVVEGITLECNKQNYDLILANTELDINKELNYLKVLQTKQLDGIIFMAIEITKTHVEIIKKVKIPIVIIGQIIEECSCVIHDDYTATKDITKLIINNNHKIIGFISVKKEDIAVRYMRFKGYKDAIEESQLELKEMLVEYGDFSIESGRESMKRIWESTLINEKPTAIIAVNDNMAFGAMSYLQDIGIKVPEECSIIGMGNSRFTQYINPKLSTVEYFHKIAGKKAVIDLFNKIENNRNKKEVTYIPYKIIERNSVSNLD